MENIGGAVKLVNTTDGQPRIWISGNIRKPSGGYVALRQIRFKMGSL